MLNTLLRLAFSVVLGTLLCVTDVCAQAPTKYALLIAVSQYDHASLNLPKPLQFPEADAKAIGAMLQEFGYEVDLLIGPQATQKAIREKLDALSGKGNQQGVVCVGFWGRGHRLRYSVYHQPSMFCPHDTTMWTARYDDGNVALNPTTQEPIQEPDPGSLVSIDEVMASLDRCEAGNRVMLADTSVIASGRDTFGYDLSIYDLPANSAALFSQTSYDRAFEHEPWGHGAFTIGLLELLPKVVANQEDLTVDAIASKLTVNVEDSVKKASNGTVEQRVKSHVNGNPKWPLTRASSLPAKDNATNPKREDVAPKTITSRTTGMMLALVPHGRFTMGADLPESIDRDDTKHSVTISRDFYLGKYEVSQEEFKRVMGFNPSFFTSSTRLPVEQISWFDAVQFCNQLSELDGRTACYKISDVTKVGDSIENATVAIVPTGNGYRLPTEAEWEYACRAGTSLPFNFGGKITPELANYNGKQPYRFNVPKGIFRQRTVAVNELGAPNKFGLVNMHGNVWEWCWDWKANYTTASANDPIGSDDGMYRAIRGGSWVSEANFCRSAYRGFSEPNDRTYSVGFRVARCQ